MNTVFEVVVLHPDAEHAEAAADAALDEVVRVEALLSRFDPASETYRVNRLGHPGPVLVDVELAQLLQACADAADATRGYFDVTAVSRRQLPALPRPAASIDPASRRVRFSAPGVFLDFGGCGKGYALDRATAVLRAAAIDRALLHGGTSSVLAIGDGPDGRPWRVGVRDPSAAAGDGESMQCVSLSDRAMSSSAVFHAGAGGASDVVDPTRNDPLREQAACVVLAGGPTGAFDAEVLSTALLAMGRDAAGVYCATAARPFSAAWIDHPDDDGRPRLVWLKP